jgi:hypothetical protein
MAFNAFFNLFTWVVNAAAGLDRKVEANKRLTSTKQVSKNVGFFISLEKFSYFILS